MAQDNQVDHVSRIFSVIRDVSASGRSAVAASWLRSIKRHGLDPGDTRPPNTVTSQDLRQARERMGALPHVAQSTLDMLFQAVGGSGCCVLLTDRLGVPVDRRGAEPDDDTFHRWGLWTGAVWSEDSEGTNGIGTCLAEQRPLTIHRDEHFYTKNIGLSCSVAPIFDHEGVLAGSLDVSSCRTDLSTASVNLIKAAVVDAARRIEIQNFREVFSGSRIMMAPDAERSAGALFALDADDIVIGATRAARLAYGLTGSRLSTPLPADMVMSKINDPVAFLDRAEKSAIQRALAQTGGNVTAAAQILGISRATLHRKMNRFKLHAPS